MFKTLIVLLVVSVSSGQVASANGGGGGRTSELEPFTDLIEREKYQQAIDKLDKALVKAPDNPDLLNLVAYSHRKLEHYEIALNYYQKALQIDPDHLGANEYLGELYLHLGDLDKALERLAVLDSECFFGCDEFDDLEDAIKVYRKANSS
jgi:tetratricopeptide (TPR) repeat protein